MIGLLSWLPTYYADRYGVSLSELGSYTVLPYLLQIGTSILAGSIADGLINGRKEKGIEEESGVKQRMKRSVLIVRKSIQAVGMLGPAICFALCAFLPSIPAASAALLIAIGSALSASTAAAVSCNHFDISKYNAGIHSMQCSIFKQSSL